MQSKRAGAIASASLLVLGSAAAMPAYADRGPGHGSDKTSGFGGYKNVVVIYQENHSFDNLYGSWGQVGSGKVRGTENVKQVTQNGKTYECLLQNDVNLTSPTPLATTCTDTTTGTAFPSHFTNNTFVIDDYIPSTAKTCDEPGAYHPHGVKDGEGRPGGCTEDLVHRFYQEQYQIDGGKQDRYVTGSDAVGLTMGVYDTKKLPIYQYLHEQGAPNYVIADNFFAAAFGGSFLNHQFLIAGRAPLDTNPNQDPATPAKTSVVDENGMPVNNYPLYKTDNKNVVDGQLTQKCAGDPTKNDEAKACGDFAVNTIQPSSIPFGKGPKLPLIDDAKYPNIGDRMNAAGVSWNWYSGGWDDAVAGHPGPNFQYHHQPFNYFKDYAEGGPQRSHLQDETKFFAAAKDGKLPQVSFVKPYGDENEHPGYASANGGSQHLVDLIKAVTSGPQAKDTLVVVTYDEFGGAYDHVPVPKGDAWGPGTRIPAMLVSAGMQHSGVDHTQYDTNSILATIEHEFCLQPLGVRDGKVNDLAKAVWIGSKAPNNGPCQNRGNGNGKDTGKNKNNSEQSNQRNDNNQGDQKQDCNG